MKTIVIALLVGSVGGLVAALCGVGGGVIMVPAFVLALGLDQKQAVATSLAVIVPTALVATLRYGRDLVDWKVFAGAAVGAMIVAALGTDLMRSLSDARLTRIFAVLMIVVGVRMLFIKA
jgi:uncharacterized membrane protein YfcA